MVGAAAYVATVQGKSGFLMMYFNGFDHSKIVIIIQMLWISHGQLAIKPFQCHFLSESQRLVLSISSYLILPSNTNAVCCLITWFLSSSGNHIAQRRSILFAMHEPASVLTLQALSTGHGLRDFGKHSWFMIVTVKPGSKITFNRVREHTPEMLLHSSILRG